jgi:hypothetical protein
MPKSIRLRRIAANDLTVDYEVQRDVIQSHIRRLAHNWNEDSVGVLEASQRDDGTIVLLDGLQRWSAMMVVLARPEYVFDVRVHYGLSIEEEAKVFLDHNRERRNVSTYDKFKVGLVAGDPACVRAGAAAENAGYRVAARASSEAVGCAGTLIRCIDRRGRFEDGTQRTMDDNQTTLTTALTIVGELYAHTLDPWRSELVEGMFIFLEKYDENPNLDHRGVVRALRARSVTDLLNAARMMSIGSNRVAVQMAVVIQQAYDARRRTTRLESVA